MNARNGTVIVRVLTDNHINSKVQSVSHTGMGEVVSVSRQVSELEGSDKLEVGDIVLYTVGVGKELRVEKEKHIIFNGLNQDIVCKIQKV